MRRLLYVAHRVPYPPDKGERVRAFHEIVALSAHFEITLAALAHDRGNARAAEALRKWCRKLILAPAGGTLGRARAAVSLLRGRSATEGFFHSRRLSARLKALAAEEPGPFDLAFAYCTSVLPACLAVPAKAHAIDFVDADSRKWLDYAENSRWPMSAIYRAEGRAVARLERRALNACQAAFITSPAEARLLPEGPARVLPVGMGVDSEYFAPGAGGASPKPPPRQGASLVFTGWMNYRPNADGVCWFVREVLPGLRRRLGKVSLAVVGGSPSPRVQELAGIEGVTVTGYVADVRPYVAAADVAVVPLRIARGVQNKVLEAMAMGKPVVASPGALTGLDVQPGRDALLAETPDQWVEHILSLIAPGGTTALAAELSAQARRCAVERFNWDAVLGPMVEACAALC